MFREDQSGYLAGVLAGQVILFLWPLCGKLGFPQATRKLFTSGPRSGGAEAVNKLQAGCRLVARGIGRDVTGRAGFRQCFYAGLLVGLGQNAAFARAAGGLQAGSTRRVRVVHAQPAHRAQAAPGRAVFGQSGLRKMSIVQIA